MTRPASPHPVPRGSVPCAAARGFTLIELMVSILVIFVLMALIIAGVHGLIGGTKRTIDAATVSSLKQGVTQFKQTFGFFPPLVKDGYDPVFTQGPLNTGGTVPLVYSVGTAGPPNERDFLRNAAQGGQPPNYADMRFSLYSLTYYLMGILEVDGVAGPGFKAVKRDGTFEKAGRSFNPFFDVSKNAKAIVETPAGSGCFELRDAHEVAFRYYRWQRGDAAGQVGSTADLNIPWIICDIDWNAVPPVPIVRDEHKNAECAIVAAGPDGLFGDEFLILPASGHPQYLTQAQFDAKLGGKAPVNDNDRIKRAMADNIVEVGR